MPAHNFERPRGRVVEIAIDSPALRDNLLGDPSVRTVAVYLPEGYDDSDADYPVVVDLAGFTGSGLRRLSWQSFGESVPQRIDRLVHDAKMGPVVAVFPDCFTTLGGNQYIDSPVTGRWEAFLLDDVLPRIEHDFRVRRGRRHRAVFGKSSGGYGALVHGMRHADHWHAVACHSGDMAFEWVYLRDMPATLDVLARFGGEPARFVAWLREAPKVRSAEMHALMILAMAASYDPAPEVPLGVRLPVDVQTCEIDGTAWARWLAHDPVRMIEQQHCRQQLSRLGLLFLDCGRRDQYYLHYGARAFVRRLGAFGIPHVYEEFDDDHSNIDYRLDVSLPRLFAAISGD
jgi:S-formylglutathione hydrolase FrmB